MKKVVAAIIKEKDRLLIAKRHSKDLLAGKWEFPGGKVEAGETPEECLKREIIEELGVEVEIGPFYDDNVYGSKDQAIHLSFYWAQVVTGDVTPVVHDEIKWININELARFDFAPADIPIVKRLEREYMSFEHGLKPSNILTNQELMDKFKCAMSGGMRFSHRTNTLVLISDHTKSLYDDRWIGDVFHYTGMDKVGDQSLDYGQNKRLNQSNHTDVTVYLFEVFKQNNYVFLGEVYLSNHPYTEKQLDDNEKLRLVWVFPLSLRNDHNEILIPIEFFESRDKIQEKEARKMSQEQLTKRASSAPKKPGSRMVVTKTYERDIYVSEFAKVRANGVCQLCEEPAPFQSKKGDPYLETHHIKWLSKGGEDTIENTVALCPNCHRKMHSLNVKKDVEKLRKVATRDY